jgi:general secretion pathway protein K
MRIDRRRKGGALLAVLWLAMALSAIALTVAISVRGEVSRTTTALDGAKAYYLAKGAVERAALYAIWGPGDRDPSQPPLYHRTGIPGVDLDFPTGVARVEIIPENSKLNINVAPVERILQLLLLLGVPPMEADRLTAAIEDWRRGSPAELSPFDAYYLSLSPSFRARHASLTSVEELLLVQGMSTDLFYGGIEPGPNGTFRRRPGLRDCVTVYGSPAAIDVNWAEPAVLASLGLPPQAVEQIVLQRNQMPFRDTQQLQDLGIRNMPGGSVLRVGGNTIYTLRATARLKRQNGSLSNLRRTVAAVMKLSQPRHDKPFTILRWYDTEWAP